MVVKTGNSGVVRLGDIATVELGGQNYDAAAQASGRPGVSIAISPTPDGNPLEIVAAVTALLPEIQLVAPPGEAVGNDFEEIGREACWEKGGSVVYIPVGAE